MTPREVDKTTARILNKAEYLNQSTVTQLDFVSPRLNELFNPGVPSEGPVTAAIDYRVAQQSNVTLLGEGIRDVREKTQIHRKAKIETTKALKERNELGAEITRRFRGLRSSTKASYKERWWVLGLAAPPESDYMGLYERCRDLHGYLVDPLTPGRIGDPEAGQPVLDFPALAAGLAPRLTLYKETIDRWVEAKKRLDDALIAKKAAVKQLNSLYANIARIQEGYFRLAGLGELADRIRMTIPSSRRPNTEPTPDTGPTSDTPAFSS